MSATPVPRDPGSDDSQRGTRHHLDPPDWPAGHLDGIGPLDPDLARDLADAAARNLASITG